LFAGQAEFTVAARQPGVENHLTADIDPLDPFSHRIHHSGAVGTADVGQPDPYSGHAVEDKYIKMVEGCRLQPHSDLAGTGLGIGPLTVMQLVGPAMLFEVQSSQ
jgi:hypothetical protein